MICLEVFRNGSRLCLAGVTSGACGATTVLAPANAVLDVSGFTDEYDGVHQWVLENLTVGDEVVLRVCEAEAPDPPAELVHGVARRPERRRFARRDSIVHFVLRRLGKAGEIIHEELTMAENISRDGTRVFASMESVASDVVQLEEVGGLGGFKTRAQVRGSYVGKDGVRRLNLRFLDGPPPDYVTQDV